MLGGSVTLSLVLYHLCLTLQKLREVAKRSIRDEIVAVRVARAKDLLRNSKMSVNDIYLKCGYSDPRSLRAVFTKMTGCSPLQWRNKKRP